MQTMDSATTSGEDLLPGRPSQTNVEIAHQQILAEVIDGRLVPGSTVSETALAKRLGMSRTPVHQALARLEVDGWVDIRPRSGVVVAPLRADDLEEVYETLGALESVALVRLATRPWPVRGYSDPVDEALLRAYEKCALALDSGDVSKWASADDAFHSLIIRSCGNRRLQTASVTVANLAHRARLIAAKLRPWPTSSNIGHREIVDAITNREPSRARDIAAKHRQDGLDVILPIVRAMEPPDN